MFNNKKHGFQFHNGWGNDSYGKWFGRGFGPGGFGPAHHFERGVLRLVILNSVKEQPRHGYDIIQELEKKFHGFYTPSAGSVYPILQLLEDQGFVTGNQKDGKKVYTITGEGEKYLAEHEEELMHVQHHRFTERHGADLSELRDEVHQTAHLIFRNAKQGALDDPEIMKRLHEAFGHFRSEVETIFSEKKSEQKTTEE